MMPRYFNNTFVDKAKIHTCRNTLFNTNLVFTRFYIACQARIQEGCPSFAQTCNGLKNIGLLGVAALDPCQPGVDGAPHFRNLWHGRRSRVWNQERPITWCPTKGLRGCGQFPRIAGDRFPRLPADARTQWYCGRGTPDQCAVMVADDRKWSHFTCGSNAVTSPLCCSRILQTA